ncbi:MAG TPA: ribonucleotide reductase [Stellaceae bacterium]|jgi:hypothetical protein
MTRIGRERLPSRRPSLTATIEWQHRPLSISIGLSPDGRVLEIFARDARPDTDRDFILDDAAVILSRALQHGDNLATLARGIGRLPDGSPASIVGALIDEALRLEASL